MSSPQVSIIIPVYNRPGLILDAAASALSEGSRLSCEVIVVDDASTDETWRVLSGLGDSIRAVRQPENGGQCAARNSGIALARGKYVKFLDSDDLLAPGHLAEEVACAESEGADIVVSGWTTRATNGTIREWDAPRFEAIVDDVLAGRAVPTSAALYRTSQCTRWDPALRKLDDWDFFCQNALRAARIATEPGSAYCMRDHSGSRQSGTSMLANALEHHAILRKIEAHLASGGLLTEARRRRLAQYYYKEMRVLSLFDREAFDGGMRHIFELDPRFRPVDEESQRWMRVAARVLGPRRAILIHSGTKKLVRKMLHRPLAT